MTGNRGLDPAEAMAADVLLRSGISTEPIDPFLIAEAHEISTREAAITEDGFASCLVRAGDEFGILYSVRLRNEGFIRFCVAHELGHYFLPGHADGLFPEGIGTHFSRINPEPKDPREREADLFATALLMPVDLFRPSLDEAGMGLSAIETLAQRFRTSLLATAIRYTQLTPDPVVIVVSTSALIDYCFVSEGMNSAAGRLWLPKGASLPSNAPTREFNLNRENITNAVRQEAASYLDMWFDNAPHTEVDEDILGLGSYGKTLTVLCPASSVCDFDGDEDEVDL